MACKSHSSSPERAMDSDALLSDGQLRHVTRLPNHLDDDPFQDFSQEEQIARLNRQCDALVIERQELQEEIDRNHKKQEKLHEAERTLQEDLARVQDRLTGMVKRMEEIERPSSKRPAYEFDIPPCTAKSSNKKPRLGQGQYSPPAEQGGHQRQDAGNTMTSERPSASSMTGVTIKREPFATGSLGDKNMTFLDQGKDVRATDDSMAENYAIQGSLPKLRGKAGSQKKLPGGHRPARASNDRKDSARSTNASTSRPAHAPNYVQGSTSRAATRTSSPGTPTAAEEDAFPAGSLGAKIMGIIRKTADSKAKESTMIEIVDLLVKFEPSLEIDDLVARLRDLVNRVPDHAPKKNAPTIKSLALMSFNFANVKGLTFTMMCVKAKEISNADFVEEQKRRKKDGKVLRGAGKQLTWLADGFAQEEATIQGRNAVLEELRFKWGRYLSYGSFILEMADLIGNQGGLIVFPFEDIYPTRRDVSTLRDYGRHWLAHRVQEEPLRSHLSKLGLIIMSATDGQITTEGLTPYKAGADVIQWKARVNKMLDHFMNPDNNKRSVKLDRVAKVILYDEDNNNTTFSLTGDHIAQLDSPSEWLTDDCIQAVIRCSTRNSRWCYVPPIVLLSIQSDPNATKPDWAQEKFNMFFLVFSTTDGSSDRGGNHFACASVALDVQNKQKIAEVDILESYQALGLCDQYKDQIRRWLGEDFDITFDVKDVHQQRDSYNCGIHVIAQGISLMNTHQEYEQDLSTMACSSLRREYRNLLQRELLNLPHQEVDNI